MTSRPRVFASGELVARAAGTDVYLLTVEGWGDRVVVRMVGAINDLIRADLASYQDRKQRWHQRRQAGSQQWPPKMPGEIIFDELKLCVTDDLGTTYEWSTGHSGGSAGPRQSR